MPGKLSGLPVWRQVMMLALWPLLEQFLGFCVGFVDLAIAGRLSVAATEAIAVASYIGWLLTLLFGAVGIGAAAVVSRSVGARHYRLARAALGQALIASFVVGAAMAALLGWSATSICRLMNLTGPSLHQGTQYLQILAASTAASGVLFVGAGCLRAAGDTRTPFGILAIVNLVNICGSTLLVFGPAPWGGWGTAGIALGTATAWLVGATLTVAVLARRKSPLRLYWLRLWPNWPILRRIMAISSPQFVDSVAVWFGNFWVASMVGVIGSRWQVGALGAHVAVIRIEAISYLPGWALAIAAATLTGQYLGLGDTRRARQAVIYCWLAACVVMGAMGLLFLLVPELLTRLVTTESILLKLTPDLLRICGAIQLFFATAMVLDQAIRGAGDTRVAAVITFSTTFLARVPAAYMIGVVWEWGVTGVWIAICGELVLRAALLAAYFASGRWSRAVV